MTLKNSMLLLYRVSQKIFTHLGSCEIESIKPIFLTEMHIDQENPGGGGVTTIYAGTGCAIFWGAFFRAENKF